MLAYLNALCNALLGRDREAIGALMRHPLAVALPESVLAECRAVLSGDIPAHVAPLSALKLYHQTAHLLGLRVDAATSALASHDTLPPRTVSGAGQIELPLPDRVA